MPVPDQATVHQVIARNHGSNNLLDNSLDCDGHVTEAKALVPAGDALAGFDLDRMGSPARVILLEEKAGFLGQVGVRNLTGDPGILHELGASSSIGESTKCPSHDQPAARRRRDETAGTSTLALTIRDAHFPSFESPGDRSWILPVAA